MKNEFKNISPEAMNALQETMADLAPAMTSTQVMEMLETTKQGQVRNTVANAEMIISYDPLLRDGFKYNELTQRIDVVKNMGWDRGRDGSGFTDNDLYNVHLYCNRTYGITGLAFVQEAVHIVANRNCYHPIRELLSSLKWDGIPRVRHALHRYLGADESDYTYELLKFFMMGAAARVFTPGVKFDYILCLVGEQGAGKSSFFRLLAIEDEWFSDDLADLDASKVYEKLMGHWIIEMSEMLATNNAKSNELIKSFLSRQKENYRIPYERYSKDRLRQCVFAGTTNKKNFLPSDRSGNRRFLPILCTEKNAEIFILDNEKESREYIRQMWAEIMEEFRSGPARLKLPKEMEAEIRTRQKQFMQEDVNAGMILAFMQVFPGTRVCSKQLFKEALGNDIIQPQRWQTNEINDIMNQLISEGSLPGWRYFSNPKRFGKEYGSQKGWERIPEVNKNEPTKVEFRQLTLEETTPFDKPGSC